MGKKMKGKYVCIWIFQHLYKLWEPLRVCCGIIARKFKKCFLQYDAQFWYMWMYRMYLYRWEKFFKRKERAQSSYESQRWCAFLLNKGKECGGKKGECIRGHRFRASHSECQSERDRGVEEHPVTYQSLLFRFYLFCCFFSLRLFTQIVFPSTFSTLQIMHCSVWMHVIVVETRERGRWGLQTPNLSFCL